MSPREALVRNGASQAIIRAGLRDKDHELLVEIAIAPPSRDRVLVNKQRVSRSAELREQFHVSIFTPDDLVLIKGGPGERRDFLDDVLEDAKPHFISIRQNVDRIIRQRNTVLKQAGGRVSEPILSTLDVWDEQFASEAVRLINAREELVNELQPITEKVFSQLSGLKNPIRFRYERSFSGDLYDALRTTREEDIRRAVTTIGPHRDELAIRVGDLDARTRLSQGQQRDVTLAMRLAAYRIVEDHVGAPPVLLLDDAFSELDERTASALIAEMPVGQSILTTTGHVPSELSPASLVHLSKGTIRAR